MNSIKIAPSILSADFSRMGEEVKSLEIAGADYIHCDVMDGAFVDNITFGHHMVRDIRKHTSLPLDVHLMIFNPEKQIEKFVKGGADIITVHKEACGDNIKNVLDLIKSFGIKCGAVISPDTPVSAVYDVIEELDMLLIMSVYPGKGAQAFIENSYKKAEEARKLIDKTGKLIDLEIDGGVGFGNAQKIIDCGVNVLVSGNTIFKAPDKAEAIRVLRGRRN